MLQSWDLSSWHRPYAPARPPTVPRDDLMRTRGSPWSTPSCSIVRCIIRSTMEHLEIVIFRFCFHDGNGVWMCLVILGEHRLLFIILVWPYITIITYLNICWCARMHAFSSSITSCPEVRIWVLLVLCQSLSQWNVNMSTCQHVQFLQSSRWMTCGFPAAWCWRIWSWVECLPCFFLLRFAAQTALNSPFCTLLRTPPLCPLTGQWLQSSSPVCAGWRSPPCLPRIQRGKTFVRRQQGQTHTQLSSDVISTSIDCPRWQNFSAWPLIVPSLPGCRGLLSLHDEMSCRSQQGWALQQQVWCHVTWMLQLVCSVWCDPWQATTEFRNRGSSKTNNLQIRVTRAFVLGRHGSIFGVR